MDDIDHDYRVYMHRNSLLGEYEEYYQYRDTVKKAITENRLDDHRVNRHSLYELYYNIPKIKKVYETTKYLADIHAIHLLAHYAIAYKMYNLDDIKKHAYDLIIKFLKEYRDLPEGTCNDNILPETVGLYNRSHDFIQYARHKLIITANILNIKKYQ